MAKRKSGWGICGSFFLAVFLVVWFVSHDDLPEIFGPHVSCTLLLFTAYAIVRTVPSANRPNRRKKIKVKMIEFLAEWMVTLLMPASHILEVRAPHLSFMMLKEYWFRELYLGLKVTASFDRSESYTRVIDGQVRCITPEVKPQNLQVIP